MIGLSWCRNEINQAWTLLGWRSEEFVYEVAVIWSSFSVEKVKGEKKADKENPRVPERAPAPRWSLRSREPSLGLRLGKPGCLSRSKFIHRVQQLGKRFSLDEKDLHILGKVSCVFLKQESFYFFRHKGNFCFSLVLLQYRTHHRSKTLQEII